MRCDVMRGAYQSALGRRHGLMMPMEKNLLNFDGRVIVVSGAAGGGIGTTVTSMLARAGATVIAVSRSEVNLEQHIAPLVSEGLSIVPVVADASTEKGVAAAMEQVRRAQGTLYGLVNVAGGAAPSTWMRATRVSRTDWHALFAQNLDTMFFMSQAVAAELMSQGLPGSLVSLSSISGMNTAPFHIGYGAAKAAMVAVVRTMAVELALAGIRVNALAPGPIATPASRAFIDEDQQRDRRAIPMGRRGRPEEIGGAVLFLLSDLSSYITGQCILVDGGLDLKWSHLADDNTSLFLKDESFRAAMKI
jgi:NAD(P)-dependent dehydrogenase (short-subunit alcohol dehydrogenase family)